MPDSLDDKLQNFLKEQEELQQFGMKREEYYNVSQRFVPVEILFHVTEIKCRVCGNVGKMQSNRPSILSVRGDNSNYKTELPVDEYHKKELENLPRRIVEHRVTSNGCHECKQFALYTGDVI